jgi:hypothetical protein
MASRAPRALRALLISSVVALAAACGGGGVKIDDLDDELIDALCERQVRCGAYASVEACRAAANASIEQIKRAIEAGRVDYDEGKAGDCIEALGDASCDVTSESSRDEPDACREAIRGTVADGGECYSDQDCISTDCTIPATCTMACCAGTCGMTRAEVAIGGSCSGTTGPCAEGSFCDSASTTCTALRAAGGACTANAQCGYGLYCSEAGTCADGPNRGNACPDGYCADIGDRCDATSMTCVPLGRSGDACSEGFAGLFDCQQPLTCDQTTLQCGNPPVAGQPCVFFCATGNFCNANDVCEATKTNGQACAGDDECQSQYCNEMDVCGEELVCG